MRTIETVDSLLGGTRVPLFSFLFVSGVTSGSAPLTVSFSDLSTGMLSSWAWDFDNDGIVDSTERSPSHTYNVSGTHTVKLSVTGGSDDEVKTGLVRVSGPLLATFPGKSLAPSDPDGDGLIEDLNGNGRLDFEDVVTFFQNMSEEWS